MRIPDPMSQDFVAAYPGKLRVVAWRQQTPTLPHPDLSLIHSERATLLHWWVNEHDLKVDDWGATDAEHPAEFVELLFDVSQVALTAAITALASGTLIVYSSGKSRKSQLKEHPLHRRTFDHSWLSLSSFRAAVL